LGILRGRTDGGRGPPYYARCNCSDWLCTATTTEAQATPFEAVEPPAPEKAGYWQLRVNCSGSADHPVRCLDIWLGANGGNKAAL
jgi:hypothetical protein